MNSWWFAFYKATAWKLKVQS